MIQSTTVKTKMTDSDDYKKKFFTIYIILNHLIKYTNVTFTIRLILNNIPTYPKVIRILLIPFSLAVNGRF